MAKKEIKLERISRSRDTVPASIFHSDRSRELARTNFVFVTFRTNSILYVKHVIYMRTPDA